MKQLRSSDEIKRIDIAEFREKGYLQEVNRRFLHPLGLALEVVVQEDGSESLGGVWDYRDDPEGMYFDTIDSERAKFIREEWISRVVPRHKALGYLIQPEDDYNNGI
jgi:hypothetical protein